MQSDGNSFCGDVALTALTWYTVFKTAFKTINMKKNKESFGIFIIKMLNFKSD